MGSLYVDDTLGDFGGRFSRRSVSWRISSRLDRKALGAGATGVGATVGESGTLMDTLIINHKMPI